MIMKALEKDRSRRYDTAAALALDVRRYLQDEPVSAGPPTARYRLGKFVKRNRAAVAMGSAVAGLAALAVVGLVVGLVMVNSARERADSALLREIAERQEKEKALAAETRAKTRTAEALRRLTDVVVGDLLGQKVALGDREKRFLRDLAGMFEDFTREDGDSPSARALRADGSYEVGIIRSRLGELAEAEPEYRRAVALLTRLVDESPGLAEPRHKLANALDRLGALLAALERPTEAEAEYRRAIAVWDRLATDFPENPSHVPDLGASLNNLAILLVDQGRQAEAEVVFRRMVVAREKLAAASPRSPDRQFALASSLINLGVVLVETGRGPEAEPLYRRALTLHERIDREAGDVLVYRVQYARCLNNLANVLQDPQEWAEAEGYYERSVAIRERLASDFPSVPAYRSELAGGLDNLANVLRKQGKLAEIEGIQRRVQAIRDRLAAESPTSSGNQVKLAGGLVNAGIATAARGKPAEALKSYDKAIALLESVLDRTRDDATARLFLRNARWSRAQALEALDRRDEAAREWQKAAETDPEPKQVSSRISFALCLAHGQRPARAVPVAESLLADLPDSPPVLYNSARVFARAALADPGGPERLASSAVGLLKKLVEAGYDQIEQLEAEPDFGPIRDRDDYRKVVSRMKARTPAVPRKSPNDRRAARKPSPAEPQPGRLTPR